MIVTLPSWSATVLEACGESYPLTEYGWTTYTLGEIPRVISCNEPIGSNDQFTFVIIVAPEEYPVCTMSFTYLDGGFEYFQFMPSTSIGLYSNGQLTNRYQPANVDIFGCLGDGVIGHISYGGADQNQVQYAGTVYRVVQPPTLETSTNTPDVDETHAYWETVLPASATWVAEQLAATRTASAATQTAEASQPTATYIAPTAIPTVTIAPTATPTTENCPDNRHGNNRKGCRSN